MTSTASLPAANSPENDALQVLENVFGYREFRPGQQETIDALLDGRDVLALMPTGGGKSLCYQIPALMLPGITVVVSPLLSLIQDQVESLQASGIFAACLNSTQDPQQQQQVFDALHNGKCKILYLSPEKLLQPSLLHWLQQQDIGLFAIDEAHCVSQWGHDFRPEYRQLGCLVNYFPQSRIIALTATADHATRSDIVAQLGLRDPVVRHNSFDRPNIRYVQTHKYKPLAQLLAYLEQQEGSSGIVYCNSRNKVDQLTEKLAEQGIRVGGYHAGKTSEERSALLREFLQDNIDVMVATVAFGMGINKSNVRFVVHYDLPRTIEAYYQETGRAGRDGLPAEALLLFDEKQITRIKEWISQTPNAERRTVELNKFQSMVAFTEAQTCRRQVLLNYFSEYRDKACGNCDICLDPPKRYDGSRDAQIVLSCILRLQQKETANKVVAVLKGKLPKDMDETIAQLPTFGLGKGKQDAYWLNIMHQLIHLGILRQDLTQHLVLKLCEPARPVLQGKVALTLAVPRLNVTWSRGGQKTVASNYDRALFAKLKHLRKQLAEEEGVPPYVVFNDASLAEMASLAPTDEQAMLAINGVGRVKLKRYGTDFIELIQRHMGA